MKFLTLACATLLSTLIPLGQSRAATTLLLDFTSTGGHTVTGYNEVTGNFLADTPTASISNIDGTGYDFSFDHVGAYDSGNSNEPLTTAGFYTFRNQNNEHSFTLSGLPVGATVDLYATAGWDGNGRGGTITFGLSTTKAQTVGDPGATPSLSNYTHINALPVVVGPTGTVTGNLLGADGTATDEGQIGAFIFEVTPAVAAAPEPSTYAMLLVAGAGVLVYRRKLRA